jgi:hypothetical protein
MVDGVDAPSAADEQPTLASASKLKRLRWEGQGSAVMEKPFVAVETSRAARARGVPTWGSQRARRGRC